MVIFDSRFKPSLRCVFLFLVLLVAGVSSAEARILNVPSEYATIPAAIAAGRSGDVIRVAGTVAAPFTYTFAGNLSFGEKIMTLESASGNPATVILTGNNTSNSTIYVKSTDSVGSTFRGITIVGPRGSNGDGGAMNIQVSTKIENCIIRDSSADYGGGVHISNGALPSFKNCQFLNNRAYNEGGAVYTTGKSFPTFINCLFVGNYVNNQWSLLESGDVMYLDSTPAKLMNCTMTGNESNDDVIYQAGSDLPLMITNCIIDAESEDHRAIVGNAWGTERNAIIVSSFIRGSYMFDDNSISNVFEPNRMQVSQKVYSAYPNTYVTTPTFELNFANNYHLNMTASAIGIGIISSGSDFDGEPRPYYLNAGNDIGYDQFNFGHLVTNNLNKGSLWFDVSLTPGASQTIASAQSIGRYFQAGKVRFYRIIPTVSGVIRLRSANATVDVKGVLTDDWTGDNVLGADDNSAGGVNFKISYLYAEQGKPCYLGVVNKTDGSGTFDLIADLVTDDRGNGHITADTSLGSFDQTYFQAGYADKTAAGTIDFDDDEDCFRIAVGGPGTLMITSRTGTLPEEFEVILKNSEGEYITENTAAGAVLIIFNNTDAETCHLTIKRNELFDWEAGMDYGIDIRYYPLDEVDPTPITLAGGTGSASANITIPGDRDTFEFTVPSYGTLTVQTTGCTVSETSKISIYNFLDEKIPDNGGTVAGTGNYRITEALVTPEANSVDPIAVPFSVSPGKYYLKVTALNGHKTPFDYGVTVNFTASATDDHGNYRQSATILRKWADVLPGSPLIYFKKEAGQINAAGDADLYRVDLPYKGTLKVMADLAGTSGAVVVELLDTNGNVIQSSADVRTANPHYPRTLAAFPVWGSGLTYTVNEIVRYSTNGLYYRCIQSAAGQNPTNTAYWTAVATPPVNLDGILVRKLNSGIHYLRVSGTPGVGYLFSVDFDDFGNDVADASEPRDDYAYNAFEGHFETAKSPAFQWSYDADAWKLQVDKTGVYTIYTTGSSDTYGILKKVDSEKVVDDTDSGEGTNFRFTTSLNPGTYYIVTCMQDTGTTGSYVLHIDQGDDYSDTYYGSGTPTIYPGTLIEDSSVMGVIGDPGDVDYFTFQPKENGRVIFRATGTIDLVMNLSTVVDELVNPSEDRLNHSNSGLLEFDVTAGDTYYLNVKPEFVMNTGSYTVTCAMVAGASTDNDGNGGTTGGDDYASARALTLSGNTASYLDGGIDRENDHDYYQFAVTGPGVVRVYTTGNTDTYGYLFLEYGDMYNLVVSNDDSDYDKTDGYNFGLEYYVGPGVRNFYVKVRGYAPHETGDYQLHIVFTPGGTDDHGDECEEATPVRRGAAGSVFENGKIRFDEARIGITGDRDYFRIVAGPEGANPGTVTAYTTDGDNAIDTFGYLKNEMCGTLALNDNGTGPGDGENFRIAYTPNCAVGVNCGPRTYYAVVRSYDNSQVGTYDLHVETNGASVAPVSTTTMAMTALGSKYFGFDTPAEGTYLTASLTGVAGFNVTPLRFTLFNGKGQIIDGYENLPVGTPIYAQDLERGLHYIRISNPGDTTGDFTLDLHCSAIGSAGFGNGAGTFVKTSTTIVLTGDGTAIDGTTDNGYYAFTKSTESFTFAAKVTLAAAVGNTQAGIELRQGTVANAKHITSMLMRNSGNTAWNKVTRYRTATGGATTTVTNQATAANGYYVSMHYDRSANQVTTGYSADGLTWTHATPVALTFSEPMTVGFISASATDGTNRAVTFSNITFTEIPYEE